jgi:hypothetical protein
MEHILILTLMVGIGNGGNSAQGSGGIAMQEFPSLIACENAVTKWRTDTEIKTNWATVAYLTRSAICVPKYVPETEAVASVVQPKE